MDSSQDLWLEGSGGVVEPDWGIGVQRTDSIRRYCVEGMRGW